MELRDYLKVLRRRWISILMFAALAGGLAAALTALQTPRYASNARLFVSTSQSDDGQLLQGGQFSAQRVKSYADLITSRELAKRVVADTGVDSTPDSMSQRVSAQAVVDTVNLDITVMDADPNTAQLIAQSYAEQLSELVRELETQAGQSAAPIKATIVDTASYSDAPVAPKPMRNVGLGLTLGLTIGFGFAVLRQLVDTRITSPADVAEITDAPMLGAIVHDSAATKLPLLTQIELHSPRAEAFRVLRTNLQFVDVDSDRKVFVVTSALPDEGKTSTALNLALSLAQGGSRTLLIECDLRRPKATARLGLDTAVGVTSVLVGRVKAEDAVQIHGKSGLAFVAAGPIPPNPAELLQSQAMTELLRQMREQYDVVLLDAPPLLPVTDAALLSAKADGAMLVISHGKVTRDQVRSSVERLNQVDAHLVGLVLNRVPAKAKSLGYGYGYGNGYGYAPKLTNVDKPVPNSSKRKGRRA